MGNVDRQHRRGQWTGNERTPRNRRYRVVARTARERNEKEKRNERRTTRRREEETESTLARALVYAPGTSFPKNSGPALFHGPGTRRSETCADYSGAADKTRFRPVAVGRISRIRRTSGLINSSPLPPTLVAPIRFTRYERTRVYVVYPSVAGVPAYLVCTRDANLYPEMFAVVSGGTGADAVWSPEIRRRLRLRGSGDRGRERERTSERARRQKGERRTERILIRVD